MTAVPSPLLPWSLHSVLVGVEMLPSVGQQKYSKTYSTDEQKSSEPFTESKTAEFFLYWSVRTSVVERLTVG